MDPGLLAVATDVGTVLSLRRYQPGERQAPHSHRRTSVTLVLRGSLEEECEAGAAFGSALSVVVKPAGIEHRDTFSAAGATTLQIILSPDDERATRRRGAGLSAWQWTQAGAVAREMLGLVRLVLATGGPQPSAHELGRRVRRALTSVPAPQSSRFGGAPDWLGRARNMLADRAAPIGVIAAEVGIHRVQLARAFRVHVGLTPSEYRRRARLGRGAGLIAGSRAPLAEAALEAGYADQAHMTREFRAAIGATPGGFRRLVAGL